MTDTDTIPMPEVLPVRNGPAQGNNIEAVLGAEVRRNYSPYAPRRSNDHAKIGEIKALLRQLLHREMRDLVKEITEAAKTLKAGNTSIAPADLADVLDKFAFGD